MRKFLKFKFLLFATTLLVLSSCEHKPDLNNFNWILGEWEIRQDHSEIFEIWKPVSDTLYEGFNFTVKEDGDTTMNEHLWLESREGKVLLSAKLYGYNEDERIFFTLTKKNKRTARFENKRYDLPTVIKYHKSGMHFLEVQISNNGENQALIKMHKVEKKKRRE
jgi:hypothetical protein